MPTREKSRCFIALGFACASLNMTSRLRKKSISILNLHATSDREAMKADPCSNCKGEHSCYRPSVPVEASARLNLELMPETEDLVEGDWSYEVEVKRQTEQR